MRRAQATRCIGDPPPSPRVDARRSAFHGRDQLRAQVGGRNDAMDGTDRPGPFDTVHAVELGSHGAQHLGPHERGDGAEIGAPGAHFGRVGSSDRGRRAADAVVVPGALVDVACEHDRRRGRSPDHGGERALDGEHLHVVVELRREHHERTTVVTRDDAEDERAVEVDDRASDLRAVLQLQSAQGFRRTVETRQVGEHHHRPAPAGRVDRSSHLLRRKGEQRSRRPLRRTVGRREPVSGQRPRFHADQRHRPPAESGVVHHRHLGLGHLRPTFE